MIGKSFWLEDTPKQRIGTTSPDFGFFFRHQVTLQGPGLAFYLENVEAWAPLIHGVLQGQKGYKDQGRGPR